LLDPIIDVDMADVTPLTSTPTYSSSGTLGGTGPAAALPVATPVPTQQFNGPPTDVADAEQRVKVREQELDQALNPPAGIRPNSQDVVDKIDAYNEALKDLEEMKDEGDGGEGDKTPNPEGNDLEGLHDCEEEILASLPEAPSDTDPSPVGSGGGAVACFTTGDLFGLLMACGLGQQTYPTQGGSDGCSIFEVGESIVLRVPTRSDLVFDPVPDFGLGQLPREARLTLVHAAATLEVEATRVETAPRPGG
jgi:hypothetical protein